MPAIQEQPQPLLIPLRDWSHSMVTAVNDYLTPDTAPRIMENLYNDEFDDNQYGNIRGRKGITQVGNQITASKSALGIHSALMGGGVSGSDKLVVFMNDVSDTNSHAYYLNSSTFTEINAATTWTQGKKVRMTTFLNYIIAVNGSDTVRSWSGDPTVNWGTTYVASAPVGSLIIEAFDQVHIGGVDIINKRSSLFSSSIVSGGSINFSGGGTELPINPDDGDYMTALDFNNELLIYKNGGMYKWNGIQTFADLLISVGCPTQECVTTTNGTTIFIGINKEHLGLYEYRGEYPNEISRPIRNIVSALNLANKENWCVWADSDHAYISVGDLTVGDLTFDNTVLRWCLSKGTWSIYTMGTELTNRVTTAQMGTIRFQSSGTRTIVVSDNNGKLYNWNEGYTDNGTPIFCRLRIKAWDNGKRSELKRIQRLALYCRTPRAVKLLYRLNQTGKFIELKQSNDKTRIFDLGMEAYTFEFELLVENSDEPFEFEGIELIDVTTRGTPR